MHIDGGWPIWQAEFHTMIQTRRFCERTVHAHPNFVQYRIQRKGITWDIPQEPGERRD